MAIQNWRTALILVLALCVAGCAAPAPRTPIPYEQPPGTTPAPRPSPEQRQAALIAHLLDAGDRALSRDRLLEPISDNAYDRFQAVLLIDPDNPVALSGLQAIVLRYVDLARQAGARGAYYQALAHLSLARDIDANNPLVSDLHNELLGQFADQQRQQPPAEDEYLLDARQLQARDERLVEHLGDIAREVRERGVSILIVARNDTEGRWIYQQMRDAVPGYLIRGDITIESQPRVKLLPPL